MNPADLFARLEAQYGLPSGHLDRMWAIESSRGKNMKAPTSSARGHFQFITDTAKQYGLSQDDVYDLGKSADAAARLAANAAKSLTKAGLPVSSENLYLYHQQGPGGASALLKSPTARAVDVLTEVYGGSRKRAEAAILNNSGNLDMSAGDFANRIADVYYRKSGQPRPQQEAKSAVSGGSKRGQPFVARLMSHMTDPTKSSDPAAALGQLAYSSSKPATQATTQTSVSPDSADIGTPSRDFLRKILTEALGEKLTQQLLPE